MSIAAAAFWGVLRKKCVGTCLQCLKGATPLSVVLEYILVTSGDFDQTMQMQVLIQMFLNENGVTFPIDGLKYILSIKL